MRSVLRARPGDLKARRPRTARGMVMLDALIAALVASVGFMALTAAHLTLMHHAAFSRDHSHALRAASQRMESLRSAADWHAIDDGSDSVQATPATAMQRRWTVQALPGDDEVRRVEVMVSWTDRHDRPQRLRLQSLIDKPDATRLGLLVLARRELALVPPPP